MASTILSDNGVSSGSAGIKTTADSTGALALQTTTAAGAATTALTLDTSQNATFVGTATATKLIPTGTSVTGNGLYLPAANALGLSTNGTNAVYIDSSQNVGIGTASPSEKLTISTAAAYSAVRLISGSATSYVVQRYSTDANSNAMELLNTNASPMIFSTSNTESMRIDSSGNVGIGTTTVNYKLQVKAATDVNLGINSSVAISGALALSAINDANSANTPLDFRASAIYASAGIGTTASAANAFFNSGSSNQFLRSTSALKYKTNIRDLESIDVNKFRPVRYNSLCESDDKTKEHFGIIADEVDNAGIKELVTYGKDNEIEGFQYERLTVVLLKAIQEQQALITALTARITALENKT